jgi:hypothetical protein
MKDKTINYTPTPLSFDGCGINAGENKERIATFTKTRGEDASHYGPMFEAAPEMLAILHRLVATDGNDNETWGMVLRIIDKAEGRE